MKRLQTVTLSILILAALGMSIVFAAEPTGEIELRQKAHKLNQQGNYKDAYEIYSKLALSADTSPDGVESDFVASVNCLRHLNRRSEIDGFREAVVKAHPRNWQLFWKAAESLYHGDHSGYIISGEFQRGQHRGGGRRVSSFDRDRVRALQLMHQATEFIKVDGDENQVAIFYQQFATMLSRDNDRYESWRLQYLTDLNQLPDYEEYRYYRGSQPDGAPVDADGQPVYYYVPKTWQDAKNDGERWRWALIKSAEVEPGRKSMVMKQFADFLHGQFGVQTMASYGRFFGRSSETESKDTGTWELHTLKENETIAKLATGVKRFTLPDEFDFIKIYRDIVNMRPAGAESPYDDSLDALCGIFENRRQYTQAAACWQDAIEKFGPGHKDYRKKRLEQIVGNWGRFEPVMTQPAGQGAEVQFRFRNGKNVKFTAHEIKIETLLEDVKERLKSQPKDVDWYETQVDNVGYRLVQRNQEKYLGKQVADWSLELAPREGHFDKRITVTTPLQQAGCYLLKAEMDDGNTSFIVLWLADTAIVSKRLEKKRQFYYIADAVTGKPIEKANVEYFGWRHERHWENNKRIEKWEFAEFAEFSDAAGQVIVGEKQMPQNMQVLVTARTKDGRLAFMGFSHVWYSNWFERQYNQLKTFVMTDRPVYRPKQKVNFKFWVNRAQYDAEGDSPFAGQSCQVRVNNPRNEKIFEKTFTLDKFGGAAGELTLETEATLGVYGIEIRQESSWWGNGTFRVEEYKKPEFEVKVEAPAEPVMLGDKITATIEAKYYFGSPVTDAKVKYKVTRSQADAEWYPLASWDWLFGKGYWWFSYDYDWLPGWGRWGCSRPVPWWWHWRATPQPELVAENTVQIGEDGKASIEIDTALAKAIHPDQDHKYSITVEVTDKSRRTIVGTGSVLVARRPFKVYAWVDQGFYVVGDTVNANFQARRLDGQGVTGKGVLRLLRLSYKDDKPVEHEVQRWTLNLNEAGQAEQKIKASKAGQYRLSYKLKDVKGRIEEGGYVFSVWGKGDVGDAYRFNALEITQDKQQYAPGDEVKLRINTDRIGSTVMLFIRPGNGVYLPPKVLRLDGKSVEETIVVQKKDMPNFFVEAVTISAGQVYTECRQIVVPPENRVLNVQVLPDAEKYKPGQPAKVKVQIRDANGEPVVGSVVLTMYDKAVEYISGGSNVPEITEFFWKWKRNHNPATQDNLSRYSDNLVKSGDMRMQNVGVFGQSSADEPGPVSRGIGDELSRQNINEFKSKGARRLAFGMDVKMMAGAAPPPAAMPAMAMEKMEEAEASPAATGDDGQQQMAETTVRTKFADTALWRGNIVTDEQGKVEIDLTMPENLTTWKTLAWAMGPGCRVGQASAESVTTKNLIIRMQAPRFFVQTDEVVLSAIVHNYLKTDKKVKVQLDIQDDSGKPSPIIKDLGVIASSSVPATSDRIVEVPAGGEVRVDWRVKVLREGKAKITMKALTDEESDAMEMEFPVYVHGMLKTESFCGVIRPDGDTSTVKINVPAKRRPDASRLEIRYSPTLAGAMLDALPYLIEYPYGCTEQTLNRFIPAVITQRTLQKTGVNLADIEKQITNLNAQEIGDDIKRMKDWQRLCGTKKWDGEKWVDRNPVFSQAELDEVVKTSLARLTGMQCSDGGWGWFSGVGERSWPHTTAVVVHGLQIAQANDVAIVPGVVKRGLDWLKRYQDEELRRLKLWESGNHDYPAKSQADNLDALVYMVLVDGKIDNAEMRKYLYRDRLSLSVYSMAVLGIACHNAGDIEKRDMLIQNISQYLVKDDENQSAWLKLPAGHYWWCWYGSENEAMAWYLKLLCLTDPKGKTPSRLVKYLLNNRRHGTYWNSTRDTAYCVEAFADYIKASGEDSPDMTVEIVIDGKVVKSVKIDKSNLFTFDNKLVMEGQAVTTGEHEITIRRKGTGAVYFNAYLTNFTLQDPISKAGLEIKVTRKYYKLVPVKKTVKMAGSRGQAVDQRVEKYERIELPSPFDGKSDVSQKMPMVKSGDIVEIELTIESKNDYEYIMLEDMKAAGFEPVELRSGYGDNDMGAYMELRDNRVTFFIRRLARGQHSLRYRMRAEIPGSFSALPTKASAMYAPELKANSDEMKVAIED